MPRALDPAMQAALESGVICPAIMAELTFTSGISYVWTGIGDLVYNAMTFKGVGSLASLGAITEGTEVKADGTSIGLSGIDPSLYADCNDEIQLGAPAKIWFALLTQGVVTGTPYLIFSGLVDKPTITTGVEDISINLTLENLMIDLQRASNRRYTRTDQAVTYPLDSGFAWVERINDIALVWST